MVCRKRGAIPLVGLIPIDDCFNYSIAGKVALYKVINKKQTLLNGIRQSSPSHVTISALIKDSISWGRELYKTKYRPYICRFGLLQSAVIWYH